MSGFWRGFWSGWASARFQRWVLLPFAALEFWAAMADTSSWRWMCLALGVLYVFAVGWLWADWARKRDMERRNAFVVEGATRADVEAFIEELEWFVKQRKAGQR